MKGISLILAATVFSMPAVAMEGGPDSLSGRAAIRFHFGFADEVEASTSVAGGTVENNAAGFIGSFQFTRWMTEDMAVTFYSGGHVVEASDIVGPSGVIDRAVVCVPILFGVKHSPNILANDTAMRPFVSLAIGPYMGIVAEDRTGFRVESKSEIELAFGASPAVGVDVFFGRHFNVETGIAYHLMTDYGDPVGSEGNHSGPAFMLGFGWVF